MDDAITQVLAWDGARDLLRLSFASALVRSEEKHAVFYDGPAHCATEGVANVLGRYIRQPRGGLRLFVEPIVRRGEGGPVVLIKRAVKTIVTALGQHHDLRAGGASGVSVGVGGGDAEFLDRVERRTQHALESESSELLVVIDAVDGEVRLVAARPSDASGATVERGIDTRTRAGEGYARLQAEDG